MLDNRLRFEKFLSFLQGVAWALALAGSFYVFFLFFPFGFIPALLLSLIVFVFASAFVVVFSMAQMQLEKLDELKKQTRLLEQRDSSEKLV